MTSMKVLATALLAVLTLSACAVTGQPARPGTAAIYDGITITNAQVDAWVTAQDDMGVGADPGAVLTLLLLRPTLTKEAASENIAFGDQQIASDAKAWMSTNGTKAVTPTPDMIDVVRTVRVFQALAATRSGAQAILAELKSIEAHIVASPMYGHFTKSAAVRSVNVISQREQAEQGPLGKVAYLVFKDVSGFDVNAQRKWMVNAGAPSPSPSPSPSTSPSPSANPSPTPAP